MSIEIPASAKVLPKRIVVDDIKRDILIDGVSIPWHISPRIEVTSRPNEETTVWIGIPASDVQVILDASATTRQ